MPLPLLPHADSAVSAVGGNCLYCRDKAKAKVFFIEDASEVMGVEVGGRRGHGKLPCSDQPEAANT